MGVWGFHQLVLKYEDVTLKLHKLQNSHLVIDGNNMKYFIHKVSGCTPKFGGDYDIFYEQVKDFFLKLNKCNVTPIVILDGASEINERDVTFRRWLNKFQTFRYAENPDPSFVSPLTNEVFKDVLSDLGILYFVTMNKSDREVATIASLLNCPVLSMDSDFFFFNIQFIPTARMDFQLKQHNGDKCGERYYLDCCIFDRVAFFKQYKLKPDFILLFPIVLGEDHSQEELFSNFIQKLLNTPHKSGRVHALLMWMQKMDTFDAAVREILTHSQDKKKILSVICRIIEYYTNDKSISPYIKINDSDSTIEIVDIQPHMLPKENILSKCPKFIIDGYIKWEIPSVFLNESNSICFSQITWEDINECHFGDISLPIFSGILRIVKTVMGLNVFKKLVTRCGETVREVVMYHSESFLHGITRDIVFAEPEERKRLIFQIVDFTESEIRVINEIGSDWSLFIISVMYWMKNKGRHLKRGTSARAKLEAAVLIALVLHVEHLRNSKMSAEAEDSPVMLQLARVPDPEISVFATKFGVLRAKITDTKYSISTVHCFLLLQSCLATVSQLNTVLNKPFSGIHVHKFFCGKLVHDVNELMVTDPLFTQHVLKNTPNIRNLYCSLMEKMQTALGDRKTNSA